MLWGVDEGEWGGGKEWGVLWDPIFTSLVDFGDGGGRVKAIGVHLILKSQDIILFCPFLVWREKPKGPTKSTLEVPPQKETRPDGVQLQLGFPIASGAIQFSACLVGAV